MSATPDERRRLGQFSVLIGSDGWNEVRARVDETIASALTVMTRRETSDHERAWAAAQLAAAREFIEWPERERDRLLAKVRQGED